MKSRVRKGRGPTTGISISPIADSFAAESGDVDLAAIKQAFWNYAVLIFPGQKLTEQRHLDFAAAFGPLETSVAALNVNARLRLRSDLAGVSNLNSCNEIWQENSRTRMIPPIGGHTEFADLRAAYDALPDEFKARLDGLIAEHSLANSRLRTGFTNFTEKEREGLPPVPQLIVRTLPEKNRKTLYIASHAGRIFGLPDAEGRALIDQLIEHATQRRFVYTHRWRLNDLVMWDDRCTMHRGTEFDDLRWTRDMQRATVSDIANSCEQESVAVPAT